MPRDEAHVVTERKQFVADGCQQRRVVPARKVGAADRTLEQHVADEREPRLPLEEHHMAGSVARAMQHIEMHATDLNAVAFFQPLIGCERLYRRKTEQFGLLWQAVEPELLFALRADNRDAERFPQFGCCSDMVDMAMGQKNTFQPEIALRDFGLQAPGLTARINQRGAAPRIPHQRAVLLIRGDGEDGKFHGPDYPPKPFMPAPDALLLISTHCPHCPAMLASLTELVKQGTLGRLEVVNLEQHPEVGQALGVRSVPWARIGRIDLAGVHGKAELAAWAAKADSEEGMADWFHVLLKEGQLAKVQAMIDADPALLAAVLPIVGNVEASLNVRLGAGVLLENFAGSDALRSLLPRLGELSQHADARVRADACHYLGLTVDAAARTWLEARIGDEDADVREIAAESLQAIAG
jgi:thiol-disulfide isomerase/thioredoxin